MRFQFRQSQPIPPHIILIDGMWYDIEPVSETRTNPQNKVLWGYFYKEAIHAFSLK